MARADRSESGFLVLADISGFTAFVTATELEHGAEVTGVLLGGVMEALAPPLEIQELEGDAVFALAPDDAAKTDRALMEAFSRGLAEETGALPPPNIVVEAIREAQSAEPRKIGDAVRAHYRRPRPRPPMSPPQQQSAVPTPA